MLACCIAAIAAVSCKKKAETGEPPIALVRSIIGSSSLPAHGMVAHYKAVDPSKSVFVAGSPILCESLRTSLLEADDYDNIDGKRGADGLPDFAGEVICTVVDFANVPYSVYTDAGKAEALREVTVRNVLAAMDTLCFINEYDRSGVASKPLPKVLVMSSPYAAEYGKYDVDTLLKSLGCRLPVVYPVAIMQDKAFAAKSGSVMVGVISGEESLSPEGYASLVERKAAEKGLSDCGCIVFKSDIAAVDPLLAFLDSCLLAGKVRPLDAIIVDDPFADADALRMTMRRIKAAGNPESLSYGNLVADGCTLQEICTSVTDECFRLLRSSNLFTHNIAFPRSIEFKTVALPDSTFVLTPYDNGDPLR